jgi:FolB domain-containing protein
MRDWVELDAVKVDAVIGVEDWEQRTIQPVELVVRMGLDLEPCGESGDLSASIDYASVLSQVETVVQQGRWRLLEAMGRALCGLLLAGPAPCEARAAIDEVDVQMKKPTVLGERATPGVRIVRHADELAPERRLLGDGVVLDVIHETALVAVGRAQLEAGAAVTVPAACAMEVIAGAVSCRGRTLSPTDRTARGAMPRVVATGEGAVLLWVSTGPLPG